MQQAHKLYFCFFLALLALLPVSLGAFDFGFITSQYAGGNNQTGGENRFEYRGDFLPRFSGLISDLGEFVISPSFTIGVGNETETGFYYMPELLRTEISLRSGGSVMKVGRMYYADPLGLIANGLFDGVQYSHNSKAGTFSVGAWYTGLLYKKTANITMTEAEQKAYDAPLDYGDFLGTYFAPRRLLASLDWEHPSLGELLLLKLSITGQADFTDGSSGEKYHSLYASAKLGLPLKSVVLELGGSLETAFIGTTGNEKPTMAFAGDFGFYWTIPASFHSRLAFNTRYAGAQLDDDAFIRAFVPVSSATVGDVFKAKLPGLTVLGLNYTARLNRFIGISVSASHFVRNDLRPVSGLPSNAADIDASGGHFLGTEFFARFIWSPVSDIRLNLGGGAFLPALGDAMPEANVQWRVDLTAIIALY